MRITPVADIKDATPCRSVHRVTTHNNLARHIGVRDVGCKVLDHTKSTVIVVLLILGNLGVAELRRGLACRWASLMPGHERIEFYARSRSGRRSRYGR